MTDVDELARKITADIWTSEISLKALQRVIAKHLAPILSENAELREGMTAALDQRDQLQQHLAEAKGALRQIADWTTGFGGRAGDAGNMARATLAKLDRE